MEPLPSTEFYDRLARAFDVMTDWPARLAFEMPFIQRTLNQHNARSVLDTACGTGWHAIALAQRGYTAAGCDASRAMIERARTNAAQAGVNVRFETADFGRLDLFPGKFNAVLCLGNSLPHLLSREELVAAFGQILGRLERGGVVILHNLNYDLRLKTKPRFFSASGVRIPWCGALPASPAITFHTALFERKIPGEATEISSWSVEVNSTLQRPWLSRDIDEVLTQAGFGDIRHFGGLDGSPYNQKNPEIW